MTFANDPHLHSQFVVCPARLGAAIEAHRPDPGVIVDFGCGRGIKTIALARAYPRARVLGVDITEAFRHAEGFARDHLDGALPENLEFVSIVPGQPLAALARADVICSWSVLEHVQRAILPGVLAGMAEALTPGGVAISQVAPLYHSPFGSHLRGFVDTPWLHLLLSHADLRSRVLAAGDGSTGTGSAAWMFARYEELNRITAPELFGYFRAAALEARSEETAQVRLEIPEPLRLAHDPAALRTNELFSVHAKPGGKAVAGGPGWLRRRR